MKRTLVSFDWAMKSLLRNRENFDVLENFLSDVLEEKIRIKDITDPESNKAQESDKFNRVDILTQNTKGEYIIIEVQNANEWDYFKRMLWGVSKLVAQSIEQSDAYEDVKKVISITIAYFDLGVGDDYVYHGTTEFIGKHSGTKMHLSEKQQEILKQTQLHKVFPEYYILKVSEFNEEGIREWSNLDEWIYLFKNSRMREGSKARGIQIANEKLNVLKMSPEERKDYDAYLRRRRDLHSASLTPESYYKRESERQRAEGREEGLAEGEEKGRAEGEEKGKAEETKRIAQAMLADGDSVEKIARITGLSSEAIKNLT